MKLIENNDGVANLINSINSNNIIVNYQELNETCIVSNNNLLINLNINSINDLTDHHIELLLSSNPELVIIGSGSTHTFPQVRLLKPIAKNNIGFEVMNNKSASRTYNVLVAEDRQVACLLMIDNA